MANTRSVKRRHLFFYLQVTESKNGKLIGYVVDITPKGLKIVSEDVFEVGMQFELKMILPDDAGQKRQIQFNAKCVWSGKDVNSDFYASGFAITDLQDNAINSVENIINEYGFEDLD